MDRTFNVEHASIEKYTREESAERWPSDRGVRLYSTASARTHGLENARCSLQIFSHMKLANGQDGKGYAVATASLSLADLIALRQIVEAAIEEIDKDSGGLVKARA